MYCICKQSGKYALPSCAGDVRYESLGIEEIFWALTAYMATAAQVKNIIFCLLIVKKCLWAAHLKEFPEILWKKNCINCYNWPCFFFKIGIHQIWILLIWPPGAGIMEADGSQVTTVFTVQPSFHHRHSTNWVSWSITIIGERRCEVWLHVRR